MGIQDSAESIPMVKDGVLPLNVSSIRLTLSMPPIGIGTMKFPGAGMNGICTNKRVVRVLKS